MAQKPTRRELRKTINQLSDEDRERVADFARRLSKGSGRGEGRESLAENDGTPSYLSVAGEREYEWERKKRNQGSWG